MAFAAGVLAATSALGIQACGDGQGQQTAPASTVVETVIVPVTVKTTRTGNGDTRSSGSGPSDPGNIRSVDWKAVTEAQPLVRDVEEVIYSDLTGDGQEDALVLARLEGSGAYLDYYVYTLQNGVVINLFEKLEVSHGQVELGSLPGSFVETTAVYGPGDPNCCPSNLLKTTYQWSASAAVFTQVTVELMPNPQS